MGEQSRENYFHLLPLDQSVISVNSSLSYGDMVSLLDYYIGRSCQVMFCETKEEYLQCLEDLSGYNVHK